MKCQDDVHKLQTTKTISDLRLPLVRKTCHCRTSSVLPVGSGRKTCGYESTSWDPRYPKIAGEWMFTPPNMGHDRFWHVLTPPLVSIFFFGWFQFKYSTFPMMSGEDSSGQLTWHTWTILDHPILARLAVSIFQVVADWLPGVSRNLAQTWCRRHIPTIYFPSTSLISPWYLSEFIYPSHTITAYHSHTPRPELVVLISILYWFEQRNLARMEWRKWRKALGIVHCSVSVTEVTGAAWGKAVTIG